MLERVVLLLCLTLITSIITSSLICAWEDLSTGREWRGSIFWFGCYLLVYIYDFIHLLPL